jgi:hypothetical protein
MSFTLEDALDIVEDTDVELLRQLPIELIQQISQLLTPDEYKEFLFAKNVKMFGGINEYANDIFDKGTIEKVKNKPAKVGLALALAAILTKILSEPGLTDENKRRVSQAIRDLNQTPSASAPAAGGAGRAGAAGRAKKLKRRH